MEETNLVILPAEASHIAEVAKNMRKADVEEVLASGGYTPTEALRAGFFNSDFASTGFLYGQFAGMFGVMRIGSAMGGVAVPWLLTTYVVEEYPFTFWKACRQVLKDLLDHYPEMVNMIDVRHTQAIAWAQRLGFHVDPPVPFGPGRLPFCRITIRRDQCVSRLQLRLPLPSP